MKILLHSNAPWATTGYGQQTSIFAPLFRDAGHDVAISAFYGCQGAMLTWNGIKVYPGGYHPYGNDIILRHAAHHFGGDLRDGLILTLVDVWVLNAAEHTRANVANWVPVDHEPAPPKVIEYLEVSGSTPIAMSLHGERMLRQAGLDPLYVPHGIDTDVYYPRGKQEARASLKWPQDAFIVGMVAANKGYPGRKGFSQAIEAFAKFHLVHPDALLYLHTEPHGVIQGVNLPALLTAAQVPLERVIFADPYQNTLGYPPEHLAHVYSGMDVLLNPAYGEGFGIPVVEAQACGTPVIVTDWTAMSELCGTGWKVGGERWWTDQGSFWKVPAVDEIVWALGEAAESNGTLGAEAVAFASRYSARRVMDVYWQPTLAELERRCTPLDLPDVAFEAA